MSENKSKEESSKSESNAPLGAMGTAKGEKGNSSSSSTCFRVRITSHRVRQLDLDNLYGGVKYFLDSLRYAEIIPDDDPKSIELQVSQKKVKKYSDEETEVEVTCVQN